MSCVWRTRQNVALGLSSALSWLLGCARGSWCSPWILLCTWGQGAQSPNYPAFRFFFHSFLLQLFHLCCRLSLRPSTHLLSTLFLVVYIYFGRESISSIPKSSSPQANGFGGVWEIKDGKQSYACQCGCRAGSASSSSERSRKELSSFIGQEGDN